MSLSTCIPDLLEREVITPDQARRASDLFEEMRDELRGKMGAGAADAIASERAAAAMEFEAAERKRRTVLRIDAEQKMEQWLRGGGENWGRGGKGGGGPDDPVPGAAAAGPINPKAARTLITLIEAHRQGIEGQAFAHITDILANHRRTVTGKLRNPAEMDEIGRAVYGEATDSLSARELADGWSRSTEFLRQRANAAGASIAKIERWGLPQAHDSRKVAEAGFDAWFEAEAPRMDRARMVDPDTGQPLSAAAFQRLMRGAFDNIASDGASSRAPGAGGRGSTANRVSQHRVLFYKDFAAWKASQEQFGRGTVFDAMVGHIQGMSRSVAAMEFLGPNPDHGARWLRDTITGDKALFESGSLRARDDAAKQGKVVERLWAEYTGALRQPESRAMALGFGAYRSLAAASKLGGATLTAVGDVGFGMATRRFNGLPQAGLISDYAKLFNPANDAHRRLASRLGIIIDTWTNIHSSQSRFLAEEITGEMSSRIADGVLRASGLNALTDAGRAANGLVWLTHITNERGKRFASLEPAFRSALQRYRIGEREWDIIRATPLEEDGGVKWIKPQNVSDRAVGDRIFQMAYNEADFAVPAPGIETRAYIDSQWRKGTFLGELVRSSPLMFKTFTVSMMIRHGGRTLGQAGIGGKLGYLVSVLIPVTLMGALGLQLKAIAAGRDPRPMDPSTDEGLAFWGNAMVKGGGLGIAGDLLGVTAEERPGGFMGYAAGPLAQDAGRLAAGLWGLGTNTLVDTGLISQLDAQGHDRRDPNVGWDLLKLSRDNVPGQNLWYAKLALDRLLADQIQMLIDPDYAQSWQRMETRARDQGQGFWWGAGDGAPERAPDLGAIAGRAQPD